MVKTQFGRKPGKKHAKIVKQLRHRRRQLQAAAASVAGRRMQLSDVVETCSFECLERQPELPFCQFCLDLPEPWWTGSACSAASDVKVNVDGSEMQLVAFEPEQLQDYELVPFKDVKALTRGASDTTVSGCGIAASIDRPTVSESKLHPQFAIPLPAPPLPSIPENEELVEAERPQHSDEDTDRYLAGCFTPSLLNITTDEQRTQSDTRSEEYAKLRNLLSSDSQHTKTTLPSEGCDTCMGINTMRSPTTDNVTSACETTSMGLRTLFNHRRTRCVSSCENSMGLNALFREKSEKEKFKPGLPTILSETSMGLNTLFHTRTIENATSCETSMGLNTLFREKSEGNFKRRLSTIHSETSMIFNNKEATDDVVTVREMPSMTTFSSTSILGNLFGSEHAIECGGDDDETLSAKERKKVLIAKDLANYLNSDSDERTQPKSKSLSTFIHQLEALFDKYRAAIAELEHLKNEIAAMKGGHHHQE